MSTLTSQGATLTTHSHLDRRPRNQFVLSISWSLIGWARVYEIAWMFLLGGVRLLEERFCNQRAPGEPTVAAPCGMMKWISQQMELENV